MPALLHFTVGLLMLFYCTYQVSGESCRAQCGQKLQNCSCHASCLNLGNCCTDYPKLCVHISPHSGTLMGGKDFIVLDATCDKAQDVICRFDNETDTRGYVSESGVHCISPLVFQTGRIPFALLCNGETSSLFSGTWLAVHHSKVSDDEKSKLSNSQKWQYYGTPGHNGSLTMTWTAGTLQTQHVSIEVWGYNETGVPYSESSEAHWTYLYTLETALPNNGSFTFTPVPAPSPYDQWEVGMLRIRANTGDEGERNVHAIWSPVHALAWHLSENFRQNPADWATNKCIAWKNLENFNLPNFQNEVADCPCTLQQSRADTGRYHTDYGCNIEKGSVCTYHQGAVHCVRSIQASPQFAAGQQCCYDASGALVLTTDSIGGSTPDRGHDWGSPPYKKPPRIPGFSHWLYDVITFYYCCLWSDNCQYYLELRPSSDCRTYKPPKVASAFGEPHIITFDGLNYTFKGKGEYYLVKSTNQSLIIQCRTKPYQANAGPLSDPVHTGNVIATIKEDRSRHLRSLPDQMNVSSISSVAMQEDNSDVVEVRLKNGTQNELETLVNGEALSFEEQTWMDVKGVFLFSPITSNVTVMFPSGAGVEVRAKNEFLSINVLLPEIFQNKTQGLLGIMNGDLEDDFTLMSGIQLPSSADPPQILKFGANWAVTEESSLFLYDSQELIDDYKLKHDPMFVPIFDFDEHKNTTLTEAANMLCGDDRFCKFDVLTTNSLEIGNATKISYDYHRALVNSLQPVVLCGRLAPPANGTKNGTNYLLGSTITLSCNKGFLLTGSTQRTCQANGHWSGEPTTCIPVSHNSCAGQCGQVLPECSCRATCEKLSNCCPDYAYSCVRISPDSGLLMGGRDFVILTTIFNTSSVVKCRFNKEIVVNGSVDVYGRAHCVSPLLYETGRIPFEVSVDGGSTYPHSGTWLSVHPGKVSESEKCTLVNETKWQYYGTPHYGGSLTVHWNPDMLKTDLVDIEVWGYTESGEPYTATWSPSWKYLYTLVHKHLNNGDFTFIPKPAAAEHRVFEFGSLRIVPSKYDDGEWNIHSIWSVDHAMAWHLGEDFRKDSAGWARDKCLKWHASDKKLPDFLSEIIDCPCTQAQSRADMGRFHPDYGCDIDSGSVCTYHQGAKHCVRAIYGSPKYAAGQQCCYDERGIQVLTSDSVGGSTPDRGHDWGSPPYRKPPRVPGFSHWLYDVITFYYCCLWSHNCQYYLELRPSSDCRTYKPPKIASAFGDPHFITFDGVNYTFKGKGEYILVSSNKSLVIQGRTQIVKYANGSASTVAGFSSVAMQEGSSDIIEVRLTEDLVKVEVLLNHEPLSFNRTWIDLKGAFLFYGADKRVTAMFSSGAGVEVSGRGRFLSINVLLPEEFMNQTQGLMGVMNNNPNDDFTLRDGRVLLTNLTSEELFQFGADWAVTNDGSLFTYDSTWLIDNYQVKHDPNFFPTFSVQENPSDPITEDMKIICGNDSFCRFDVLTTRDLDVGIATLMSHANYKNLSQSLQPVVSCGWLETPKNGKKEGTCYLYNYEVIFTCNTGYILVGSYSRKCQADGTWSGQSSHCVSDNTLGIVLGCVFGFLTLLILLILIALHEKKHSKKKEMNVPSVSFHQIKDA